MIHADSRTLGVSASPFGLAALQVAGEVWGEAAGNLHADAVTFLENVAGDQVIQAEFVNPPRLHKFPPTCWITVAGANDIQAGAHEVVCRAIRRYVQQSCPEIKIRAVARNKDALENWPGHLCVVVENLRVECEYVFTSRELALIVRP